MPSHVAATAVHDGPLRSGAVIHGTPATASPPATQSFGHRLDADAVLGCAADDLEEPLAGSLGSDLRGDVRRRRQRHAVAHDGDRPGSVGGDEDGVLVAFVAQPAVGHASRKSDIDLDVLTGGVAGGFERRSTRLAELVVGEGGRAAPLAGQEHAHHHHDLGRTALARSTSEMRSASLPALRANER